MCKRSTRGRSASTMLENPSNLPDVTPSRRCSSIAWKKAPAPKPSPTDPEQGIAQCPRTRQQPRDGVNRPGFAGSMDLKTTLGNIYPDHPHFHVDLLASGLWPIDPEPGSRGASITSYRCNHRPGRPERRIAVRSSACQRGQNTAQRIAIHLRVHPHAHTVRQSYLDHPFRVVYRAGCRHYLRRGRCRRWATRRGRQLNTSELDYRLRRDLEGSFRQVPSPCVELPATDRRATVIGDTPGSTLSVAISRFCSTEQRRRLSARVITSIR